ncbi:hypothetical protein [Nocardioides daejeonensis]|uniref:hypothetical protein n=1 Tax=Nocardioides daejeonensis TaxID=1046556 RepID=UPI000D7427FF|nr:hypothetical protein [Nocardioides daejeonensis]
MSAEAPEADRTAMPAAVRIGWAFVRTTAGFGWRLVQKQAPLALTAGPLGRAVAKSRTSAALRSAGRDVLPSEEGLLGAYPHATSRILVLVPDSAEDEGCWSAAQEQTGGSYASRLASLLDWTPVHLRCAPPSLEVDRAAEVSALVQRLVDHWPEPVQRVAVVAHGDGGLALRAAAAVRSWSATPWQGLVSDVVLLGTPHLLVDPPAGSLAMGRQLDEELAGIVTSDRVAEAVEPIPAARYVVITRPARLERSTVGSLMGSLLWWRDRSRLRRRSAQQLFPTASVVHVEDSRLPLTNHPEVQRALLGWLA